MITFAAHQVRAGLTGASEDFEQMLALLVRATSGDGNLVFANPGDWGIDVLVGDLRGRVTVWQAKYFMRGVARSQQSQIAASFDSASRAAASHGYTLERWVLCIPASLDPPTTQWWAGWKAEQERDSGVSIELWDETILRGLLLRPEAGDVRRHYYNPYMHDGQDAAPSRVTFPYRGLGAFGEQDSRLFFGRDAATAQVMELMATRVDGAGMVVVSGVSGAGKSSLLHAGVMPGLRKTGLAGAPEAASWPCVVFTPGRCPLEELAVRIAPLARADAAVVRERLVAEPTGFALTARQVALSAHDDPAAPPPGHSRRRVLLVVDQCEQLFTLCEVAAEREAFITALRAAATGRGTGQEPAALVVLVIRADFEARLADYPELIAAVQDRYLLTAMTERQLRLAITRPATVVGSRVEDDLVQVLLDEVRARTTGASRPGQPAGTAGAGVLPLLSHALDQAWRTRAGHALTLADYERTGGIEGAVAASAQRAYERLTPAQQEAARQVFTRLTATGSDGTDTAACVARSDLLTGKTPGGVRDLDAVLEEFAAARLLVLDADTVEISHEALLTAWPLLRDDWLAGARADRIVTARLHATAQEWVLDSRDPSYLYTGSRLDAAAGAAARIEADPRHAPLSQAERDFLHASQYVGRRRTRLRQSFTMILLALLAGLTVVAVAAFNASQIAARRLDAAVSAQLISESQTHSTDNATISRQDSIAAWALEPSSAEARYAMLTAAANSQIATIADGTGTVGEVVFSPDGKVLAANDGHDVADLWDVATLTKLGSIPHASVLAFSPDGKLLAATGSDGIVRLWNVATRTHVGTFATRADGKGALLAPAVFSPDGKVLAIGVGGALELWTVPGEREIRTLGRVGVPHLGVPIAFMPGDKILLTYDETPWTWDMTTGKLAYIPISMPLQAAALSTLPSSPNGTTVLGVDHNNTLRLWDAATRRDLGVLSFSGSGYPPAFAFSPDGSELATGDSSDGTVRLLDVGTRKQIGAAISTNAGGVFALAFSPDGRALATGDRDGTIRLWDVATDPQIIRGPHDPGPVAQVAFKPNGKSLMTADTRGAVRVWDTATREQDSATLVNSPGEGKDPSTGQISPDGRILALAYADTVQLWNVAADGRTAALIGSHKFVHWPISLAFNSDSKTLAIGDNYGHIMFWDVATDRQVGAPLTVPPCNINSLAFSKDGKVLADAENSGRVRLWDVATRHLISSSFTGSNDGYFSVALSPDGKTIAAADGNNAVELWDVASHKHISGPLTGGNNVAAMLAFSPDGQTLAVLDNGIVRLWDVATGHQIGAPLSGNGGISTLAFSPDGRTLAIGDSNGTTQLWNVAYLADPLALLCSQIGGSLTPAEWKHDVPPGPAYRNVCP
jgi:WD40 repeat protein